MERMLVVSRKFAYRTLSSKGEGAGRDEKNMNWHKLRVARLQATGAPACTHHSQGAKKHSKIRGHLVGKHHFPKKLSKEGGIWGPPAFQRIELEIMWGLKNLETG